MERPMQKLNDLSRSLTPLEPDGTLIAVIEMSQSSWLVADIVPGVERQPLKKLRGQRERIAEAAASMARGSRESRTQDRTHCSRLRGWPGWFLAGALVEGTQHRGPRYPRIERSRIARAPARQDRPARHRAAQTRLSRLAARRA